MMIVVMKKQATVKETAGVIRHIEDLGLKPHISQGEEKTIIGAVGDERSIEKELLLQLEGVEAVIPILKPYKLASLEFKPEPTVISLNGTKIGNGTVTVTRTRPGGAPRLAAACSSRRSKFRSET